MELLHLLVHLLARVVVHLLCLQYVALQQVQVRRRHVDHLPQILRVPQNLFDALLLEEGVEVSEHVVLEHPLLDTPLLR